MFVFTYLANQINQIVYIFLTYFVLALCMCPTDDRWCDNRQLHTALAPSEYAWCQFSSNNP